MRSAPMISRRQHRFPGLLRRRRHGAILLYVIVAIVALFAMVSLAVDFGRVQCAKAALRDAADAAARYGAIGISDGTAISKAVAAAHDNLVDGTPLVLDNALGGTPRDVEVGNWDATLSPQFSTSRTPVNAVRVTARRIAARNTAIPLIFGRILGRATCDIGATCVARAGGGIPNFIGLRYLTASNNTSIGYNPTLGAPGASNTSSGASIASNGTISFAKNASISGTVLVGPGGSYTGSSPSPLKQSADFAYPAAESPPFAATGSLAISSSQHIAGGGTLVYTSITIGNNATLFVDNPTTIYVTNDIIFNNSGAITPASGLPADLRIRIAGSSTSVVGGSGANNVSITAQIYAPNSDFVAHNNGTLYGTALFRSMSASNQISLYYDVTSGSVVSGLSNSSSPTAVTFVQ